MLLRDFSTSQRGSASIEIWKMHFHFYKNVINVIVMEIVVLSVVHVTSPGA